MKLINYWLLFGLLLLTLSPIYAQTGQINGKIYNTINNEPIVAAAVIIKNTQNGTESDLDGNYLLQNLQPGFYTLSIQLVGFKTREISDIEVTNARPVNLDIALEESVASLEELVIRASPFTKTEESPVSLRTIGVAEIQRSPGGARDISKVVQSLPGVTSVSSFRNDLIIRGGAPNENRFYLDDIEVPNINHFATQGASGGPVGLINVDFVREVDFYSSAFPANRGNALSSVFNFKFKDGRTDRLGFTATVGASDLGMTLEGPIGNKTTFLASARRSYLQLLFKALELPFLPTYNDFQVKVKTKLNEKNELTFIGLGAIDQFALNLDANETEEQRYLLNNLPVNEQWNYTNGLVYKHFGDKGYWTVALSRNMLNNTSEKYKNNDAADVQILDYQSQEIENKLRVENTTRWKGYKLNYGTSYEFVKYNNKTLNRISVPSGTTTINYTSDFSAHKYALFAQLSNKWFNERLTASAGLRADGNSYSDKMSNPLKQVSPRIALSYALSPAFSINVNSGMYYQLPPYTILGYQQNQVFVNKETTKYIQTTHVVGGISYETAKDSRMSVEGYYKRYNNYPFTLRDSINLANLGSDFGVIGNEPTVSNRKGETFGLEVLFQQRLYKGYYGIVAYTLGVSRFEDKNNEFVASSWDGRHIVNLTGGKRFKKNWELGLRWRFQSGLPYTPFDASRSALIANWDITNAPLLDYNQLNVLRRGATHALDMRLDKKFYFKKWSLNPYIDIQNAYNKQAKTEQLILDADADGNAQIDPQNGDAYLLKTIYTETGTLLPTIGLIIAY